VGLLAAVTLFGACTRSEDATPAPADSSEPSESAAVESAPAEPEVAETSPGEEAGATEEGKEDVKEPASLPKVTVTTSMGTIQLELMPESAPKTVDNFLQYVRDGFFDGTIFHRVMPGFVIQGGGFTADMDEKQTRAPIQNEADNGVRNLRGTICMARTRDPHSATSQFFINTKDNAMLDFTAKNMQGWGYAVFGKVTEGMDVVDAIEKVQTSRNGMHDNVPVEPVVIESVRVAN